MSTPPGTRDAETLLAHRAWVRTVARALVAREDVAEDIEQDLWLGALSRPPRIRSSVRGWLATALRSLRSNRRRADERRRRHEREAAAHRHASGAPPDGPAEVVANAEAHRRVVAAVLALDEPYRSAVLLRYYEELPPARVAARLGVPVETVRTRVRRGLARLRAALDASEGGDRRAWCLALLPLARAGCPPSAAVSAGGAAAQAGLTTGAILMAKKTAVVTCLALVVGAGVGWLAAPAGRESAPERTGGGAAPRRHAPSADTDAAARLGGVQAPQDLAQRVRELERENADLRERLEQARRDAEDRLLSRPPDAETVAVVHTTREAEGADTGTLRCYVFDRRGRPQAGTGVTLYRPPEDGREGTSWTLTTGPDGSAETGPLPPGSYQAILSFPQGSWTRNLTVAAGDTSIVRFWVWAGDAGTVRGTVMRHGGDPAPDAMVFLSRYGRGAYLFYQTRTDDEGRYAFEDVPAGRASVRASLPTARLRVEHDVDIPSGGEVDQDFELGVPSLHGAITDRATALPIEGVRLLLDTGRGKQWEALSDEAGRFAFPDIPTGTYVLGVFRDGYGSGWRRGIEVVEGGRRLDLALAPAAVLVLRILRPDGQPYTGQLFLSMTPGGDGLGDHDSATLTADERGVAVYRRIVPGDYTLRLTAHTGRASSTTPREEASLTLRVLPGENEAQVVLERP